MINDWLCSLKSRLIAGGAANRRLFGRKRNRRKRLRSVIGRCPYIEQLEVRTLLSASWFNAGPSPIQDGQIAPNTQPDRQVNGAIHTVLAHPTDADTLYIGSVNGGIWKTTNATATNPTWTVQTDDQTSLSIGAMVFDPTDASHDTLVAGHGRFSSFSEIGRAHV